MTQVQQEENEVRARIVTAAGEVFAEIGFAAATVRAICKRAGINSAAINYYFGGKEKLYREVLRAVIEELKDKHPLTEAVEANLRPEDRLKVFIKLFLGRLLDTSRPVWAGKIVEREASEPTEAFEMVFNELIEPTFGMLRGIVTQIYESNGGAGHPDQGQVELVCASIIGQCTYYFHARTMLSKLAEKGMFGQFGIERLAEHVAEFSLRGIR